MRLEIAREDYLGAVDAVDEEREAFGKLAIDRAQYLLVLG